MAQVSCNLQCLRMALLPLGWAGMVLPPSLGPAPVSSWSRFWQMVPELPPV